jgi:hypothetical protein
MFALVATASERGAFYEIKKKRKNYGGDVSRVVVLFDCTWWWDCSG